MAVFRYAWQKALAGLLFPQRHCLRCGRVSVNAPLCPECRAAQAALRCCPGCATFVRAAETADYRCENCRGAQPPFVAARAALPYEGRLRDSLLDFKYHDRVGLRRPLAALLLDTYARFYAAARIDAVVPLPLAAGRLRERGYNQAALLTEIVSQELALPHRPDLLARVRDTRPLASLSRAERERELTGAFRAAAASGLHLLLVDDIYTTGATAATASRALLRQGAAAVHVLAVAAGRDL